MSTHSIVCPHDPTRRRAAPLPPDERRAAILAATVPLLREHGVDVTTRQIANAAGVVEGTLFRVFPDKETLVRAAVSHACSPDPMLSDLAGIDRSQALDERLLAIATMMQARLRNVVDLMTANRMRRPLHDVPRPHRAGCLEPERPDHAAVLDAIAALLEPYVDQLAQTPRDVARLLLVLSVAGSHSRITDGEALTTPEIVSVLLDGVRQHRRPTRNA